MLTRRALLPLEPLCQPHQGLLNPRFWGILVKCQSSASLIFWPLCACTQAAQCWWRKTRHKANYDLYVIGGHMPQVGIITKTFSLAGFCPSPPVLLSMTISSFCLPQIRLQHPPPGADEPASHQETEASGSSRSACHQTPFKSQSAPMSYGPQPFSPQTLMSIAALHSPASVIPPVPLCYSGAEMYRAPVLYLSWNGSQTLLTHGPSLSQNFLLNIKTSPEVIRIFLVLSHCKVILKILLPTSSTPSINYLPSFPTTCKMPNPTAALSAPYLAR
jgi:hypothetical protein